MTRRIAVLTGKAGAGKTTVAKYLMNECGFERVRFAGPLKDMVRALGFNDDEIEGHLKEVPNAKLTFDNAWKLLAHEGEQDAFEALGLTDEEMADPASTPNMLNGKTVGFAMMSLLHVILACVAQGGEQGATPRSLMQMIGTEWGRNMIDPDLWIRAWLWRVNDLDEDKQIVVDDCRFPNEAQACADAGTATFFRIMREQTAKLAGAAERGHESEAHVIGYHYTIPNNSSPGDAGERVRRLFWGSPA